MAQSMITAAEAERMIFDQVQEFPMHEVLLEQAFGGVLREEVLADRDYPPADRATMDGIAISHSAWKKGLRKFLIEGMQQAGKAPLGLKDLHSCFEITTGALLPDLCDCVIPVEEFEITEGQAVLKNFDQEIKPRQNVHGAGNDYKKNKVLLKSGVVLNPVRIAIAAAVGQAKIKVSQKPKIAVIGTGDELVEIDQKVKPYQARRSNAYAVQAALNRHGYFQVERFHVRDDKTQLRQSLKRLIKDFDVLILSGGVSMGKFDFVPEILIELKVRVVFHKVKQRPGMPFWFGLTEQQKPVFALPGNPVSTKVCTYRYVLPYLLVASGVKQHVQEQVALADAYESTGELTCFFPVRLEFSRDVGSVAKFVSYSGSGNYAALADSDGFVELGQGQNVFENGQQVKFYRW